jgi:hypothetical protein
VKKPVHFKSFAEAARQNTPHVHVCARLEAPNSKLQAPEKYQTPIIKTKIEPFPPNNAGDKCGEGFRPILGFEVWCFSGVWRLVLGIFHPAPNASPKDAIHKKETPPGIRREGHGLVFVLPCRLLCCAFVP